MNRERLQTYRALLQERNWLEELRTERDELEERYDSLAKAIRDMKENVRQVNATIGEFLGKYHIYCDISAYQQHL